MLGLGDEIQELEFEIKQYRIVLGKASKALSSVVTSRAEIDREKLQQTINQIREVLMASDHQEMLVQELAEKDKRIEQLEERIKQLESQLEEVGRNR